MANKQTGNKAASHASEVMRDNRSSSKEKSAAASALSQKTTKDRTSGSKAASEASRVMRDDIASRKEKSAAASTLSQKEQ